MQSIPFNEANTLIVPSGTSVNLKSLPVYTDGISCVSVWEITPEELALLAEQRKFYIIIGTSPDKHPAIGVCVDNIIPDFKNQIIQGT